MKFYRFICPECKALIGTGNWIEQLHVEYANHVLTHHINSPIIQIIKPVHNKVVNKGKRKK